MKFTFKTERETGKWAFLHPPHYLIKLKGKEVGNIEPTYPYSIRFMIYKDAEHNDNNPNCSWMWVKLNHKSVSLEYAKIFVNDNIKEITSKYKLYFI
jgi:hypothetical protein